MIFCIETFDRESFTFKLIREIRTLRLFKIFIPKSLNISVIFKKQNRGEEIGKKQIYLLTIISNTIN